MGETLRRDFYLAGDGVRLHAIQWGSEAGQPMLLLHGCGSNALYWNAVAPLLVEQLGDRFRVVALDDRGAGDSDKPRTGYDPESCGCDVLSAGRQLGEGPMTLVGHSRGGWLATYIAAKWPERVRELILIDPARRVYASKEDADDFYESMRESLGPFPSEASAIEFARQREPEARWTPKREEAFFAGFRRRSDGALVAKLPAWVLGQLREAREGKDGLGPLLPRIGARTLLFVAARSGRKRQEQKLEYSRMIPGVRVEFANTTHYIHQDDPELVALTTRNFLNRP